VSKPGPAAQIRRWILDAASLKLAARTQREQSRYASQMYAYLRALDALADAGAADPGTVPYHGTYESPLALAEVIRCTGGPEAAARLGFTAPAQETGNST
jgi:hypothetical protein